jgi:hypothetical protein
MAAKSANKVVEIIAEDEQDIWLSARIANSLQCFACQRQAKQKAHNTENLNTHYLLI